MFIVQVLYCPDALAQPMVSSHEIKKLNHDAHHFMKVEDYGAALDIYMFLDSISPNTPELLFNIGLCTFRHGDKPSSLLPFLKALKFGYDKSQIFYYIGVAYQFNYDLENALYYLNKFIQSLDKKSDQYETLYAEATALINQVKESKGILDQRLSVNIENLGEQLNSTSADYVPMSLAQDSILIFTSRRIGSTGGKRAHDGHHYEDIYVATKADSGVWTNPRLMHDFNGKHHDANVALNKNETILYVYKAFHNGDIFQTLRRSDNRWEKPKPVQGINTVKHWEGSIALSPSEDTIFFSSDRPGGYGGSDIYFAIRNKKGGWTDIQNIGPEINTAFDEDAPFLYKDGKTFFFSSKGHNSVGGYDVFSVKRSPDGKWSGLKNLGFPINTVDDDIYFHLNTDASIGYFTSFRHSNFQEKSVGEKDIFQLKRPHSSPVYFVFKGLVRDSETHEPLPAVITLKNLNEGGAEVQKLVVDINSGKFRCDLKFDNRYELNVEIGDKVYYSKELYFPYQPDLFETFLDIPLKDIPRFKVKLRDVLENKSDSLENLTLDEAKTSTVVLVRKVPVNDAELRELLTSSRIPVSFRKKLLKQIEGTSYMDAPVEGTTVKQLQESLPEEPESLPIMFARLDTDEKSSVERIAVKDYLGFEDEQSVDTARASTLLNSLPSEEKNLIEKFSELISLGDSADLNTAYELYFKNLKKDELVNLNALLMTNLQRKYKSKVLADSLFHTLANSIHHLRKKIAAETMSVQIYDKEGWGLLHTVETSVFKNEPSKRFTFRAHLYHRNNNAVAGDKKLLLTDDFGMIYEQTATDSSGYIEFANLQVGKRYHVLVDDYAIWLLGQSRFELKEVSMLSAQKDYLSFYDTLSALQKRAIDRVIARRLLAQKYQEDPTQEFEDEVALAKLDGFEKKFLDRVARYLAARSITDSAFLMRGEDATRYEELNTEVREVYNRYIGSDVTVSSDDSTFYNSLSQRDKLYVDRLAQDRKARRTLLDDVSVLKNKTDLWYVLDQLNTRHDEKLPVDVSGKVAHKIHAPGVIEVALMDEYDQLAHLVSTDSAGNFYIPSVKEGKRFKVLIALDEQQGNIADFELRDLRIERGEQDFYNSLSATEKRMVNRIIGVNLARESYEESPDLLASDTARFNRLSVEERAIVTRLKAHLLADTVTHENMYLQQAENQYYYSLLKESEREYINRNLVRTSRSKNMSQAFLSQRDSMFYHNLTERQKKSVGHLQLQRKAKKDLFAENPTLMAASTWNLTDSLDARRVTGQELILQGEVVDQKSLLPMYNVPLMVMTGTDEVLAVVSTDSLGRFAVPNLTGGEVFYLLLESRRQIFNNRNDLKILGLQLASMRGDTTRLDSLPQSSQPLTLYFSFDSFVLSEQSRALLEAWMKLNARSGAERWIIEGHADSAGSASYNLTLSHRRASAVVHHLEQLQISKEQMIIKAKGESLQRYSGRDAGLNRRVEIRQAFND